MPHRRLIRKIESYGINGNILKWIKGFLGDRRQTVKVNDVTSEKRTVRSGIPQGSVLGPLLFIIYINDLPEHVLSEMYLFADDTKLMKKVELREDSFFFQNDIDVMLKRSDDWQSCHSSACDRTHEISHNFPGTPAIIL